MSSIENGRCVRRMIFAAQAAGYDNTEGPNIRVFHSESSTQTRYGRFLPQGKIPLPFFFFAVQEQVSSLRSPLPMGSRPYGGFRSSACSERNPVTPRGKASLFPRTSFCPFVGIPRIPTKRKKQKERTAHSLRRDHQRRTPLFFPNSSPILGDSHNGKNGRSVRRMVFPAQASGHP